MLDTTNPVAVKSVRHPPGRGGGPGPELFRRPGSALVAVTGCAGIRDAGLIGFTGSNEPKGMGCYVVLFDCLLDERHMAGDALTSGAALGVMGMLSDGSLQPRRILLVVTGKAQLIAFGAQV